MRTGTEHDFSFDVAAAIGSPGGHPKNNIQELLISIQNQSVISWGVPASLWCRSSPVMVTVLMLAVQICACSLMSLTRCPAISTLNVTDPRQPRSRQMALPMVPLVRVRCVPERTVWVPSHFPLWRIQRYPAIYAMTDSETVQKLKRECRSADWESLKAPKIVRKIE